ncbi:hypothetical protein [Curtobacterium sp. VKM Ac-1395]|uniref:hypothetical protein n=1 Tax=Curtobacterium sp. VKM Ac-1395 TaxID=2783815 RepID=UPI00188C9E3C|nr:hypothetical protein [Curtobacterium sp. VKM Ac-1395]MBF4592054.1 hypothetical protein [Curtobacterium sp. VKM Ac-1395]
MTAYQLAFEDTEVARIRPVGSESAAALAWFKVVWRPGTHEAETVHIYGPGLAIRDRQWLGEAPSIAAAVAFCDRVERNADAVGEYDWAGGTVETSPGE